MVHGDEPLTNEVIRQVPCGCDPAELPGTLLAVPVVNTLAFEALTRHTPQDQLDRAPGDYGYVVANAATARPA